MFPKTSNIMISLDLEKLTSISKLAVGQLSLVHSSNPVYCSGELCSSMHVPAEWDFQRLWGFYRILLCTCISMVSHFMHSITESFSITNAVTMWALKDSTMELLSTKPFSQTIRWNPDFNFYYAPQLDGSNCVGARSACNRSGGHALRCLW